MVSFDEEGGRAIERYYTDKKTGKQRSRYCQRAAKYGGIQRVGFHWTATTSAARGE